MTTERLLPENQMGPAEKLLDLVVNSSAHLWHNQKKSARMIGVRLVENNVATLLEKADLAVDCFDNLASRTMLSTHCRARSIALVHAAISGDGTFGLVRWDARFAPDAEDHQGQATCEGGEHLPLIGLVTAALARAIQDFVGDRRERDFMVTLSGVTET